MDRQFLRTNHRLIGAVQPALRRLEEELAEGGTGVAVIEVRGAGVGASDPLVLRHVMSRLWGSFCERHGHGWAEVEALMVPRGMVCLSSEGLGGRVVRLKFFED